MCHDRLAEGEAPACVQACPTEAISITIVNTAATIDAARSGAAFLPAAPDPAYTVPTTQYVTEREIPADVEAADLHALRPEHAHLPLVVMLVLTQFSVGLYTVALILGDASGAHAVRIAAFVAMAIGLAASTSHLGRPLGAWRAFLGLRRSWLSREIVVFGGFSGVAAAYTAAPFFEFVPTGIVGLLGVGTVLSGLLGVFCSVMIYVDTQRPFWSLPVSFGKFFGTMLALAAAGYLCVAASSGLALILMIGYATKLVLEGLQLCAVSESGMSPAKKSASLMLYPLRTLLRARFAVGGLGLGLLALLALNSSSLLLAALAGLALLTAELLERVLFFKAVAAPKMPGAVYS